LSYIWVGSLLPVSVFNKTSKYEAEVDDSVDKYKKIHRRLIYETKQWAWMTKRYIHVIYEYQIFGGNT
jgi:hypothetical protein